MVRHAFTGQSIPYAGVYCRNMGGDGETQHVFADAQGQAICGPFHRGSHIEVTGRQGGFEDCVVETDLNEHETLVELYMSPVLYDQDLLRAIFTWEHHRSAVLDLHVAQVDEFDGSTRCEISST